MYTRERLLAVLFLAVVFLVNMAANSATFCIAGRADIPTTEVTARSKDGGKNNIAMWI